MVIKLKVNPEEAPKLQKLLEDEAFAETLFAKQTPEEVQAMLKGKGVSLTIDEIVGMAKAINDAQKDELTEDSLEDVAGGLGPINVYYDAKTHRWTVPWYLLW